jgi:hypothetical protein
VVEVERGGEALGAIGDDGEEAEEKAADSAGEDCGCDGAVGGILWDELDFGHFVLPMSW